MDHMSWKTTGNWILGAFCTDFYWYFTRAWL